MAALVDMVMAAVGVAAFTQEAMAVLEARAPGTIRTR
jgi:hypothetical protein